MRAALVQLCSSDDPIANLGVTRKFIEQAASDGANMIFTPEVTNCVSTSRTQQMEVLCREDDDPTLAALREDAAKLGVWISLGSLALKTSDPDGRFANRSFLISPNGSIVARYDKIHMFDVQISATEGYRESAGYRPGTNIVVADTDFGRLGMTICYDMRFPALFRELAQRGAEVLIAPSAFSPVTGAAHWESLLRARAIQCGAYVVAAAQCGSHKLQRGKPRNTWGHSLVVAPWGEVLADGGEASGVIQVEIDLAAVQTARARIPALHHDRHFEGPG